MTQSFGPTHRPSATDPTFDFQQETDMTPTYNAHAIEQLTDQQVADRRGIARNRQELAGLNADFDQFEDRVDGLDRRTRRQGHRLDDVEQLAAQAGSAFYTEQMRTRALEGQVRTNGQTVDNLHTRLAEAEGGLTQVNDALATSDADIDARFGGVEQRFGQVDAGVTANRGDVTALSGRYDDLNTRTLANAQQADAAAQSADNAHTRIDEDLATYRQQLAAMQQAQQDAVQAEVRRQQLRTESIADATRERNWQNEDEATRERRTDERTKATRESADKVRVSGRYRGARKKGGAQDRWSLRVEGTLADLNDQGVELPWEDMSRTKRTEDVSRDKFVAFVVTFLLVVGAILLLGWAFGKGCGDNEVKPPTADEIAKVVKAEMAAVTPPPAPDAPSFEESLVETQRRLALIRSINGCEPGCQGNGCCDQKPGCTVTQKEINGVNCQITVCEGSPPATVCDGAPGERGPRGYGGGGRKKAKADPAKPAAAPAAKKSSSSGYWVSFRGGKKPVKRATRASAVALACGPALSTGAEPTGRICDASNCDQRTDWFSAGCR